MQKQPFPVGGVGEGGEGGGVKRMTIGWLRNFRTGGYFCWGRQYPITCHVSRIIPVMCLISIEQHNEEGNSLVTDPSNNQVSFSRPDTN